MNVSLELRENTVVINGLTKPLGGKGKVKGVQKYERIYYSVYIAGLADGTLIYFDPSGHLHVGPGTGPKPTEVASQVKTAVAQIAAGVNTLVALGVGA